jgi:hypothetical protein
MPKSTSLDLRELTEPFNAWCAQRKISRSLAIRQVVKQAIGSDRQQSLLSPTEVPLPSVEWDGLGSAHEKPAHSFTLRLTASQRERLQARAHAAGISCSRYILAAITARDSDALAIAGKDAVQALTRSNDLLARTALKLSAWHSGGPLSDTELVKELQTVLREHLERAAAIVSQIELTRVGRSPKGRAKKKAGDAKPGGTRSGARALG